MLTSLLANVSAPLALLPSWLSPEHILSEYGLIAVLIVIFAETGLLIGFFLPGDTLLFSAGILTELGTIDEPLWMLVVLVPIAAILGNLVGYEIGRRAGPALFERPNSRIFRKDHLDRSRAFFDRYGTHTIFLARFVPIVRTFAAVVAGAVGMNHRLFLVWSVIGAIVWTSGLILLGYGIAAVLPRSAVDFIQGHIDLLIIGVVVLTVAGIVVEQLRHRPKKDDALADGGTAPQDGGTAPQGGGTAPQDGGTAPQDGGTAPQDGGTAPQDGGTAPQDGATALQDGGTAHQDAAPARKDA